MENATTATSEQLGAPEAAAVETGAACAAPDAPPGEQPAESTAGTDRAAPQQQEPEPEKRRDQGATPEGWTAPQDVGTSAKDKDESGDTGVFLDVAIQETLMKSSRLRELNNLFAGAMGNCLSPLTDQDVRNLMKELPEPYLPVLKELNNQVYQQISQSCAAEFIEVIQDNQIDVHLNELDFRSEQALRLLGETVDPKQMMATERVKVKKAEVVALQKMMEEVQITQIRLEKDLQDKRSEAREVAQKFLPIAEQLGGVEDASRQWTSSY